MERKEILKKIPSVDEILLSTEISPLVKKYPRSLVVEAAREATQALREYILSLDEKELSNFKISLSKVLEEVRERIIKKGKKSLRKAINATGVIIHTNLGRAPLSEEAQQAILDVSSYCNLEIEPESGRRGSRYLHVTPLLTSLTGAEDALVVNNNAAAVFLILSTFAKGREVIVSRGELVEIGGSFRLPEIMSLSGAKMVEVGTTNRTYLSDYEEKISEETALLLKVHRSNFRLSGFVAEVSIRELALLGEKYGLPVVFDAGSGALVDFSSCGLGDEPTLSEALKEGADIVTASGDKLLGGPQAGIIIGKKEYVEPLKKNHLLRALRIDKLTLASLEVTLRAYFDEVKVWQNIPVLKMIGRDLKEIEKRAKRFKRKLEKNCKNIKVCVLDSYSEVGGGSMPGSKLPTKVVLISFPSLSPHEAITLLRESTPSVFARIEEDSVVFDFRTVEPEEDNFVLEAVLSLVKK